MAIYLSKYKDNQVIIKFPYSEERVMKIKCIVGRSWHQKERYWTIPLDHKSVSSLYNLFAEEEIITDQILSTLINQFLSENKYRNQYNQLRIKTDKELQLKGYSKETIKAYLGHIHRFFLYSNKDPYLLSNEDIKKYLIYLLENNKSHSYTNQAISSIRFFFLKILQKEMNMVDDIPRPKTERKLPDVLSPLEVQRILNSVKNMKHRMILLLIYSAGLRVSEVVRLKPNSIDEDRMLIHVKQAKGRKDRYTILSSMALNLLKDYIRIFQIKEWLFPGEKEENHLTERSVQKIFEAACQNAKITKNVSVHSLRHYVESQIMGSAHLI